MQVGCNHNTATLSLLYGSVFPAMRANKGSHRDSAALDTLDVHRELPFTTIYAAELEHCLTPKAGAPIMPCGWRVDAMTIL
jgi:hypothetical protein